MTSAFAWCLAQEASSDASGSKQRGVQRAASRRASPRKRRVNRRQSRDQTADTRDHSEPPLLGRLAARRDRQLRKGGLEGRWRLFRHR
jgi:hypothetical protein